MYFLPLRDGYVNKHGSLYQAKLPAGISGISKKDYIGRNEHNMMRSSDNCRTFPLYLTCTDYSIVCRQMSLQPCRLSNVANRTDKDL